MTSLNTLSTYPILQVKKQDAIGSWDRQVDHPDQLVAVIDLDGNGKVGQGDVVISSYDQLKQFAEGKVVLQSEVKRQKGLQIEVDCEGGRSTTLTTLDDVADNCEPVRKSVWGIDFSNNTWFIAEEKRG